MDNDKLTLLIDIAVELHARETSNNCIHTKMIMKKSQKKVRKLRIPYNQ